jgi:methionyl-tRNA synthetase
VQERHEPFGVGGYAQGLLRRHFFDDLILTGHIYLKKINVTFCVVRHIYKVKRQVDSLAVTVHTNILGA